MAPSLCAAGVSLHAEGGGIASPSGTRLQYQLTAGAVWSHVSALAIVTDDPVGVGPALVLAAARLDTGWFRLDLGRIGIPLGLVPPIYTAREPLATTPDTYSAFNRATGRAFGIPDYGVGLATDIGPVELHAHWFRPPHYGTSQTMTVAASAGLLSRLGLPIGVIRELLGNVVAMNAPSLSPQAAAALQEVFNQFGSGPQDGQEHGRAPSGATEQLGLYYAGLHWRVALDAATTDFLSQHIQTAFLGVEWSQGDWIVGTQPALLIAGDTVRGGLVYAVHAWGQQAAYVRGGWYSGPLSGHEMAVGWNWVGNVFAARVGYEFLRADLLGQSILNRGPAIAFSARF